MMDIIGRLWSLLTADRGPPNGHVSDEKEEGPGATASGGATRGTTRLYHCTACGTTYIATELDLCPECRDPVEVVPDERDLGLR